MNRCRQNAKGFTLITTLVLLFLLSALSIGILLMVNSELKVSAHDVQNNVTFHAAEGAIEKQTADISNLFTNTLSPQPAQLVNLATNPGPPNISGITFPAGGYTISPVMDPNKPTQMLQTAGTVSSGPYAGLNAQLLQVNLQATAQGLLGDEVQMSRTVEIAMIPVFQFGAFSDGDISFFDNPTLTFNGRIHTNGDLYLGCAGGNTCTFTDKLTAYGNIIRANIPNGVGSAAANNLGSVNLPGKPNGCTGGGQCTTLPNAGNLWGSVVGAGGNPPASAYNNTTVDWVKFISTSPWDPVNQYLGGMLLDGNYGKNPNSGATDLTLPFVAGATLSATPGLAPPPAGPGPQNYEIVRRAPAGENPQSPLGASRMYNEAAIRVLLSDRPDELPGGAGDPDNVRLANLPDNWGNGDDWSHGVPTKVPAGFLPALAAGQVYTTYFATASTAIPNPSTSSNSSGVCGAGITLCYYSDWLYAPGASPFPNEFSNDGTVPLIQNPANNGVTKAPPALSVKSAYPYYAEPTLNQNAVGDTQWNLIDGYLRVEFLPQNGACPGPGSQVNGYCAITREWLQLGFARDLAPPTTPAVPYSAATSNDIDPYAILIFQQPAKRNTTGWPAPPAINKAGVAGTGCVGGAKCTAGSPPEIGYDQTIAGQNPYHSACSGSLGTFTCTAGNPSRTAFNWYPINFYDVREGEPDDIIANNNSCTPQGVMNAVELDVGNLNLWLKGNIPGSGTLVNFSNQNGYILYFSDRRGMLPNPKGTQTIPGGNNPLQNITGDAGFEDVVNTNSGVGRAPDGQLEAPPLGRNLSPEDANLNGLLDNFGAQNLGLGLGYVPTPGAPPVPPAPGTAYNAATSVNSRVNVSVVKPNPYLSGNRMSQCSVAQDAWISGARHVLKLVDGSLGNLPTVPGGVFPTSSGGFTVGSENPVYVVGNYNTNCPALGAAQCTPGNNLTDPNWPNPPLSNQPELPNDPPHAAASIVADTVTLLSNSWSDWNTILLQPTQPCTNGTPAGNGCNSTPADNRDATNGGYYRMAIATGDVQAFPRPAWANGNEPYIGTDGGMGNFLRLLEVWKGQSLYYNGSMVNLFYSTYNTGLFKCCGYSAYVPPTRKYNFDVNFNVFSQLPPGTPMFRDIDNLSYRQNFTPCSAVGANNNCSN